jgi:hypothetical protein
MIDAAIEWIAFELMDHFAPQPGAALDAPGLGPIETPYGRCWTSRA